MGSGGSRLGASRRPSSRPHRHPHRHCRRRSQPGFKRFLSSLLVCGALPPSSNPLHELEDDPAEKLVNSAEHDVQKIRFPAKSSSLPSSAASEFANPTAENGGGTERSMVTLENTEDVSRNVEVIDKGKSLSKNKEVVSNPESISRGGVNAASTSYKDEHCPHSEAANGRENADTVGRGIYVMDDDIYQHYAGTVQSSFPSDDGLGEALSDRVSVENSINEMAFHDCETTPVSALSASSTHDTFQPANPSGLGFLVRERDQGLSDGNVLEVDAVSVSSSTPSTSASEMSSLEARRNGRRLFWDAFSRRGSRRNADSRSFLFATNDSDVLDSHNRWLVDFNADIFDDGIGGESRSYGNSNQYANERRWRSSSEIWDRFRDVGHNGADGRTATCPSGVHPDGACSCGSMIRAEESGARASISRIVMLAEALFEVLDEIHRQPMSLPLSVVSLPAPESVVDSLPVKDHKKAERLENGDDVVQCYICLAEYEEGDKIRILPCHHEYHASCIDKWLKEIHGVCPLCRGEVRDGSSKEGAISSSGVDSL